MDRNLARGIVHIAVGLIIASLMTVIARPLFQLILGTTTFVFVTLDLLRLRSPALNLMFTGTFGRFMREYELKRLTGASCLLIAGLATLTIFGSDIAVLAMSFLALGDPVAHIVRDRFGRIKIFDKTLEGALACLVVCAAIGFLWYQNGLPVSYLMVGLGAVTATITQVLPLPVDDNLTIPLVSGLVMWLTSVLA